MTTYKSLPAKSLILVVVIFFLSGCKEIGKKQYSLHIKGSESMHETFDALKKDFESIQDTLKLTIEGGGSKTGLAAIANGTAEIGMSSFPFDLHAVFGEDHRIGEEVVAYDGIVVINHMNNPVRQLTNDQIAGIFSGEITNWSQLGGNPGQIIPIIRDQNSGTQKFFTEFFGIEEVVETALVAKENAEIVSKVKGYEGGIGFIGFAYFTESINNVLLRSITSDTFVPPIHRYMHDGSYPLKRSLHIYYKEDHSASVKSFLCYLNSSRGQSVIEMQGLILKSKMR